MVILCRVKMRALFGLTTEAKPYHVLNGSCSCWGRDFRRIFRGISWVYEITKYFRHKKTMADGEEDEYEAHLDHLQRSKDLKAKPWFGKCCSNISLKESESPARYWKNNPSKWMNHLLRIGFKTSDIGGQIFSA